MQESRNTLFVAAPIPSSREGYFGTLDYKAAAFSSSTSEAEWLYDIKRKNAVWDPRLRRYRCKPGLRYGGRITNRMGAGCGGAIVRALVGAVTNPTRPDLPGGSRTGQRISEVGKPVRGARRAAGERRAARRAAGQAVRAANTATELARGDDQIPEGGKLRQFSPIETAGPELNMWGRLFGRLADALDTEASARSVDIEAREDIDDLLERLDIPSRPDEKKKEKLRKISESIEKLTEGNLDDDRVERIRKLAQNADERIKDRERVNLRERRGIARRERDIERGRRLQEMADRLDFDDRGEVSNLEDRERVHLTSGGPLRNPNRRPKDRGFMGVMQGRNEREKNRVLVAAVEEYADVDGTLADLLGKGLFTFDDINKYIKKRRRQGADEAEIERLRALREDWAELHPIFGNPLRGDDMEMYDKLSAISRIDKNRLDRIVDKADLGLTHRRDRERRDADLAAKIERDEVIAGHMKDLIARRDVAIRERMKDNEEEFEKVEKLINLADSGALRELEDMARFFEGRRDTERQLSRDLQREFDKMVRAPEIDEPALEDVKRQLAESTAAMNVWIDLRDKALLGQEAIKKQVQIKHLPDPPKNITKPGQKKFYTDAPTPPPGFGDIGHVEPNGMPKPNRIENSKITTAGEAVDFVKNGGDMSEVPNEFWAEALEKNSSGEKSDNTTRFYRTRDKAGAMGDTIIFNVRNAKGDAMFRGWVIKAQNDGSNLDEKIGWAVLGMGGADGGIAVEDGRNAGGNQYIIIPHAGNFAVDGQLERPPNPYNFLGSFFDGVPDEAIPQRVVHLLNNYMLDVGDRHYQNGMAFKAGEKAYAIPIDYGGFANARTRKALVDYYRGFGTDKNLLTDARGHLDSLWRSDPDEALRQAKEIVDTFDGYVANIGRARGLDEDEFEARIDPEGQRPGDARRYLKAIGERADLLESDRKEILNKLIPDWILKKVVEEDKTPEVPSAPIAKSTNPLNVPNEVLPDSSMNDVSAAKHLKNGGDIALVPDNLLFEGMVDPGLGTLMTLDGKNVVDARMLLDAPQRAVPPGATFQNDRFVFKAIKNVDAWQYGFEGPWTVFEVIDKADKKTYFMKANNNPIAGDGVGEAVGGEIARIFGFEQAPIRVGNVRQKAWDDNPWRWVLVPHVEDFHPEKGWIDIKDVIGAVQGQTIEDRLAKIRMNETDVARLLVMDYLMNNTDRHQFNFLLRGDDLRNMRVQPIDHGLIGMARRDFPDGSMWDGENAEELMEIYQDWSPERFAQDAYNNITKIILNNQRLDAAEKERIQRQIDQILKQIKNVKLDDLFDPNRIGRRGVSWNSTELQHIEAIKTIFEERLGKLIRNSDGLVRAIQ